MSIVNAFPAEWRTDVIVHRGGRDPMGNPLPDQQTPLEDCLVGPRPTADPLDRSDVVDAKIVLYRDPDPAFTFRSTDRIEVPAGHRMAGLWAVDGRPGEWPLGAEVGLVRA